MTLELELSTRSLGEYWVIKLKGEVDIYTAPRLREAIAEAVDEGHYKIVVDLEDIDFLDSTGLGVLVGGLKRVKPFEGEMAILCAQEKILRVFKITGLIKVFRIYSDESELNGN